MSSYHMPLTQNVIYLYSREQVVDQEIRLLFATLHKSIYEHTGQCGFTEISPSTLLNSNTAKMILSIVVHFKLLISFMGTCDITVFLHY